jgi:imidazoleglycerol-phosphate dehydratase/histidinol-phosphatase
MTQYPYLFVDRDGTLIEEPLPDRQVDSLEKLQLMPEVIPCLRRLIRAGYRLVMVSNQDGLGTEQFPQESFDKPQAWLLSLFQSQGIEFEDILICPHFESDGCECRKPKAGLLFDLLASGRVDLKRSAVVGDSESDVILAKNIGVRGFLYHKESNDWPSIALALTSMPRSACVERKTKETYVSAEVHLDRTDLIEISTGQPFFDHMLVQIATHAGISIRLRCEGDWEVDDHHSIEDCALVLGEALRQALGPKCQIQRFGFTLPMDECLAQCAVDLSGRAYAVVDWQWSRSQVGGLSCEMVPHFFRSLATAAGLCLHLSVTQGNTHHQVEALFKAFGRALGQAVMRDEYREVSSKGGLE